MPKINDFYGTPAVDFNKGEEESTKSFVRVILKKKRRKGRINDRVSSEMGEQTVDILLESFDATRKWMRGPIHYDFTNFTETVKLEIKTRKFYANFPDWTELDVRLDKSELEKAHEGTHLIPLIHKRFNNGRSTIISPGVFSMQGFIEGVEADIGKVPKTYTLKKPCIRTIWRLVLEDPIKYDFMEWEDFIERIFKGGS